MSVRRLNYPYESLRELYEIVERRDGAVYRTRYVRDVWVGFGPYGEELPPANHQFVSKADGPSPRRRVLRQ